MGKGRGFGLLRRSLRAIQKIRSDKHARQKRSDRLRMFELRTGPHFVIERSQLCLFVIRKRAAPGSAGETQYIVEVTRLGGSQSPLNRDVLLMEIANIGPNVGRQRVDPAIVK